MRLNCRSRGAATEVAAKPAGGQHGPLAAPLPGQGPDLASRYSALRRGPLRALGLAVGHAEHIVSPLVEADGAIGDVVLVVQVLAEAGVGLLQLGGECLGSRDHVRVERLQEGEQIVPDAVAGVPRVGVGRVGAEWLGEGGKVFQNLGTGDGEQWSDEASPASHGGGARQNPRHD